MSELNMRKEYRRELRLLERKHRDLLRGHAVVVRRLEREIAVHDRALAKGVRVICKRRAILQGRLS